MVPGVGSAGSENACALEDEEQRIPVGRGRRLVLDSQDGNSMAPPGARGSPTCCALQVGPGIVICAKRSFVWCSLRKTSARDRVGACAYSWTSAWRALVGALPGVPQIPRPSSAHIRARARGPMGPPLRNRITSEQRAPLQEAHGQMLCCRGGQDARVQSPAGNRIGSYLVPVPTPPPGAWAGILTFLALGGGGGAISGWKRRL